MDQKTAAALLAHLPTPFYAFDLAALRRRVEFLKASLPPEVQLCFAVKANPFLAAAAAGLTARLELCSPGEVRVCQALGLGEDQYVVSGVYKSPTLMRELISGGSGARFTAESPAQFTLLLDEARRAGRCIPVLLRLSSGNQFGMSAPELERIVSQHQGDPNIDLCGIQFFSGTQKTSLKKLGRELAMLDEFLARLDREYGFAAQELEYGPGFPVSYFQGDAFDEAAYLSDFAALLSGLSFRGQITLELGRSIAASCGTYFTRVVDEKTVDGQRCAIVDGGIHQITYYGQSMAMKFPHVHRIAADASAADGGAERWNIFGSLCTVNDILVKQLPLPGLSVGDVLAFENAGAYCMTEGISLFLTRELPAVVLLPEDAPPLLARARVPVETLNTPDLTRPLF